jgi:branched-chain amino acid transport system ATP-binding protein
MIEKGEILGIIGPNGAGKSTLFNAIVMLVPPTSGRIHLDGQDLVRRKVHEVVQLGVGKTSQTVQIFGEMTVLQNATFGSLLHERHTHSAREAAMEELRFMDLAGYADLPAADLTLAQRATLELTRVLAVRPRVSLVDEVMAGLDELEVNQMLDRLTRINQERGITVLASEHTMRAIMHISHRILVPDYGQVIALGDPVSVSRDQRVVDAYLGVE